MYVIVMIEDNIDIRTLKFENAIFNITDDNIIEIECVDTNHVIAVFNLEKIIGVQMG